MTAADLTVELCGVRAALRPRRHKVAGTGRNRRAERAAVLLVGAGAVTVLSTGVGYAYWSASGHADGASTTLASRPNTLAVSATAASTTATLHPGGSGNVAITFDNPNAFAVTVTGLTFGAATAASCTTSGVTISPTAVSTALGASGVAVPAKSGGTDGSAVLSIPSGASMSTASTSDCQSKSLTIPVTVTWTS
jgi:hypothetical protein